MTGYTSVNRLLQIVLPLTAIGVVVVFILHNSFQSGMYLTHDGEIHMIRALHFIDELQRGQFPVRMAPELAFWFGYPIFQFFYPLPYYVTAIFQLTGLSTTESWKLMLILVTSGSLWACYHWLRCSLDRGAALIGTMLYGLIPFRLLTLYVTGQIGGYFSLLFAPLIGWGLHKLLATNDQKWGGILLALGIAGLLTSHLLSAIIFFLPLAGYGGWLLYRDFSWHRLSVLLGWSVLGVGLSAFYVVPFLLEKSWVRLGHEILINHRDHWPSLRQVLYSAWGYGYSGPGDSDGMSFQVGMALWLAWIVAVGVLVIQLLQKKSGQSSSWLARLLAGIFVVLVVLMLPVSGPVWEVVTPLQFLQYPWRLLAAVSLVGCWLAGWSIGQLSGYKRWVLAAILLGVAAWNVRNYVRPWPLDWHSDTEYQQNTSAYYGPTDISWELLPITATTIPTQVTEPVLNATQAGVVVETVTRPPTGATRLSVIVQAAQPSQVNLAIWDLPVWEVWVNDVATDKTMAGDGSLLVPIPAGQSEVKVVLVKTSVQRLADLITLMSSLLLIVVLLRPVRSGRPLVGERA